MGMQHMTDQSEPVTRPLERAGELERDEAALARSPSPEHKPRNGTLRCICRMLEIDETRGRLKRIFALGAAAIALGQARRGLEPAHGGLGAGNCRRGKLGKRREQIRLGLDGQKRDEERRLLQLVDRVLRRVNRGR